MKKAFYSLAVAISFIAGVPAHAESILSPITPSDTNAFGFAFDITAKNSDGIVKFRVVISEKEGKFSSHPLTTLRIVKSTGQSRSIAPMRELPSERKGHSIVCVFTVKQSDLNDPSLCFVFTNYDERGMPAADFAFARLQDFAKRQP